MCVAFDTSGNVFTSAHPTGGATWRRIHVEKGTTGKLTALSCASTSLCVAFDHSGSVLVAK